MNSKANSPLTAQKSSWLPMVILGSMSIVMLAIAAGARMEEGRFVYRTYLLIAGGLEAMVMALVLRRGKLKSRSCR
jgi:hypothetical protein